MGSYTRLKRPLKLLTQFLGGQASIQVLNGATGIMLLRLMSTTDYATYSLAFGIQCTLGVLTDLGFGGAVIALTGSRYTDREIMGRYVGAASFLRKRLLAVVIVIAAILVPVLKRSPIPTSDLWLLVTAVLVALQFQGWTSYFDAPLLLHGQIKAYYFPQILGGIFRLSISCLLFYAHILSAVTAVWVSTGSSIIIGIFYRYKSRDLLTLPNTAPTDTAREMARYLFPLLPATLYLAFQSQISLFLIATFGHLQEVAKVAALGRLGQLFLILNLSNSVLLAPHIAKLPKNKLAKRFLQSLAIVAGVATLLSVFSMLFPEIFLYILGPRYQHLNQEAILVVISSSIGYVTGALWSMNSARQWVFWWSGTVEIIIMVAVQLFCILRFPLSTAVGVLKMGVWVSTAALFVQALVSGTGFHREHRHLGQDAA